MKTNDVSCPTRASDYLTIKHNPYGRYVQLFYGFVIDPEHTEALSDKEKETMKNSKDLHKFYTNLVSHMKDTVEDGVSISYDITDSEFGDEIEFGDDSVLIVGCVIGSMDFHYSGVTRSSIESWHKNVLCTFVKNNPRFKNIEPSTFAFARSL